MEVLTVGTEVGARRWPYHAAHPDYWGPPWKGVLVAENDPRACEKTLAFPFGRPSQEEVDAHIAWCRSQGLMNGESVPGPLGLHGRTRQSISTSLLGTYPG